MTEDLLVFEANRGLLVAVGYRMLGDRARAEELVQDAWLRWAARSGPVDDPRAWLATVLDPFVPVGAAVRARAARGGPR